jgi:hypothetical protein
MMKHDSLLPDLVRQANRLRYDYADGDGIDYEPFETFLSSVETEDWFRAWTGNQNAEFACFRVFGQDGAGGYVAFWVVRDVLDILCQPIVFLGSEGEIAVLARNFKDYLWLLAAGIGPSEAASCPDEPRLAQPMLAKFAESNAPPFKEAAHVLADARAEFPQFERFIESQCR